MRAYFFSHAYLSQIQRAIQAQHCTAELFVDVNNIGSRHDMLVDWAKNHKTTIVLNGGNSAMLQAIEDQLNMMDPGMAYPWSVFREDDQSMEGMLTCVGIVLPEHIYEAAAKLRAGEDVLEPLDMIDMALVAMISSCGLA